MVSFRDVVGRALSGTPCSEREYDIAFSTKLKEVVKEYGIKSDPENPVPSDNTLADDVFKAAFEFACGIGVYCVDSGRIMKFEETELKERLKTCPERINFGEGLEAGTLVPRKPEDRTPPWLFVGAGGVTVSSEEIFQRLVEEYAREIPLADAITTPCLSSIDGVKIRPRSPVEIEASIRTVKLAREALRRAGRPGLPIMNSIGSAESDVALLAGLHPDYGLRKTDGYMVPFLCEFKTNFDILNRVTVLRSIGVPTGSICGPMYGGYCGGAEGMAVATTAYHFAGLMTYRADWYLSFPFHIKYIASSTPELIWISSVYNQAVSRNTHLLSLYYNYTAAGPCTEMCFLEIAAQYVSAIASGANMETGGVAKGKYTDRVTPLEPRFAAEVSYASTGLKRIEANDIIKEILPKYVNRIADPPMGLTFQESCDMTTGKPSDKCLAVYNKTKKEMSDLGLEFPY